MGKNFFKNWTPEQVAEHNQKHPPVRFVVPKPTKLIPGSIGYWEKVPYQDVSKNDARYKVDPFPFPPVRFREVDYEKETKRFSIKIDPMGAVRCNRSVRWKKSKRQEAYFAYKDRLREVCEELEVPDEILITAWIAMPHSWSKRKHDSHRGFPHRQKPDSDNICKAVKDALFKQDDAVWSETTKKFWADTGLLEITLVYWRKKVQ